MCDKVNYEEPLVLRSYGTQLNLTELLPYDSQRLDEMNKLCLLSSLSQVVNLRKS